MGCIKERFPDHHLSEQWYHRYLRAYENKFNENIDTFLSRKRMISTKEKNHCSLDCLKSFKIYKTNEPTSLKIEQNTNQKDGL